jgi:hypothetical protein
MSKIPALQVVTANDLLSGDVVYLSSGGCWRREVQHATLVRTAGDADFLMAQAAQHEAYVVGPYLAEVSQDDAGRIQPTHYRERIRTLGPSNRPDLGRQAEGVQEAAHVSL